MGKLVPVISCRDRTLKVMDKAKVRYLFHLDGIPTALGLFNGDGGDIGSDVLVGSSDGCLCLVSIGDESAILRWTHDTETSAGVTCVDFYDVTANGGKELLVGFDDGTVQVYGIDGDDYQLVPPRLLFSQVICAYLHMKYEKFEYVGTYRNYLINAINNFLCCRPVMKV